MLDSRYVDVMEKWMLSLSSCYIFSNVNKLMLIPSISSCENGCKI